MVSVWVFSWNFEAQYWSSIGNMVVGVVWVHLYEKKQ